MIILAWDTETALIERGLAAPPITCVSYAVGDTEGGVNGQIASGLMHWKDAKEELVAWLEADEVLMVGQNVVYDMAVICAEWPDLLPLVFEKYEKGLVTDTMLRAKLLDLAEGRLGGFMTDAGVWVKLEYSLQALAKRYLKVDLEKDLWRLRYGELRDVPIDQWEEGARKYAIDDAVTTLAVYYKQEGRNKERGGGKWLADEYRQARAAWWLQLMTVYGLRTNPAKVDAFVKATEEAYKDLEDELKKEPWGLVRKDGSRNIQRVRERLAKAMGGEDNCRKTDAGAISTDAEACKSSDDDVLIAYSQLSNLKSVVSKDVPILRKGRYLPLHSRINTILETGRTSSSSPNIQNPRRLKGIRECFVPRPGYVFVSADYKVMELHCLAEVQYEMFGRSDLGDAINAGMDPHMNLGAHIMGISYEEAMQRLKEKDPEAKAQRQMSKAANFGYPGGLGAETFVFYAKMGYGVVLTVEEAKDLKENAWKKKYREMGDYMDAVSQALKGDYDGRGVPVTALYSNRVRGGCRYCQAANTPFQALCADAAKAAGFLVSKACHVTKSSPLYGSHIVNFLHDEFVLECPEDVGHDCAMELARLMVEGATPWLPRCPPEVDAPVVSKCWSKDAEQVWQDGRLIAWDE